MKQAEEAKKAAEELAAKKAKEQEAREVAAYEQQRAEKLAKQASMRETEQGQPVKPKTAADINPEREAQAAKDAADIAYWEAIQEMRREE
jgi:hypothetical protein